MNYSKECNCCWHKLTAYTHNLNKWLVSAFCKLMEFYNKKRRWANLQKDLDLTKNEYNNFQKLRYFWLVWRKDWLRVPTLNGISFYDWRTYSYNKVASMWNQPLPINHEARSTETKNPKKVWIDEVMPIEYKRREEYGIEKRWTWQAQSYYI